MKWEKDWLFTIIYRDIENLWARVLTEGKGTFGPSPDYLLVSQFSDISVQSLEGGVPAKLTSYFKAPAINQWIFDGSEMRLNMESHLVRKEIDSEGRMFYRIGTVDFYISGDRKLVVMEYIVGPRYGEQRVFKVEGQGHGGKLVGHPDFILWRS